MLTVLLQALAIASVGFISPGSITLVILLLMSDKGWRNGVAFVAGYLTVYSLIGVAALTLGLNSAENTPTEQSAITSLILIALGALLLTITIRNWRKKPAPDSDDKRSSRFTRLVDGITPLKAFAVATAAAILNMKNLAIFLSAAAVLRASDLLLSTQLTMLIPLVLVFCTSVITPIAIYFLFPDQATDYLNRIKDAISHHSRSLGLAVTLILSFLFLYRGLSGLL